MSLEAHIYFVPASHLHHISSGSWMQLGDCIVHVRPCGPDSDLYAVILGCSKATPSSERRQALRALAREEASPTLHPMVMRMLQNVELPSEGPAPLLSLSQLMRQNPKDWYKPWEHPHCPVWRICRQRLAGLCHLAFYSRGAISSTEAVESSLGLREFDFEVLLSRSDLIVVTCNPLTNSAATQEGATDRRMQNSSWLSSPPSMDRVSCT